MDLKDLKNKITEIPFQDISIGYRELNLTNNNTFDEFQLGYRIDPKGKNLCGKNEGDWKESWYVIATDDMGDPIFIDLSDNKIYTAMHGEGTWDPTCIATNFEELKKIIVKLKTISKDRESPVELEKNPIEERSIEELEALLTNDGEVESWYWSSFLED